MKDPHPRFIAFLGAIVNAVAFGSLFLIYVTITNLGDTIFPPNPGVPTAIEKTGWASFFDYGTTPVPLWFWLIPLMFLLLIFFPLILFLVRLLWYVSPRFFLWSSLASLPGIIWCLLWDSFLASAQRRGEEAIFTLEPGAGLLLLGLCISSVCSILLWGMSSKASQREKISPGEAD